MKIKPKNPGTAEPMLSAIPSLTETNLLSTGRPIILKQILVPIEFSYCSLRALDYARTLAAPFEAKVTLLHVIEPAGLQQNYLGLTSPLEDTNQSLAAAGRERLELLSKKPPRLRTETLVRIGRAYSEIPDTAKALSADLIIMGTHGYTGLNHMLLGSTAERVVRQAPCPVLTVRHTEEVA